MQRSQVLVLSSSEKWNAIFSDLFAIQYSLLVRKVIYWLITSQYNPYQIRY